MLKRSLNLVITDEGFDLPCDKARGARICAQKLLVWIGDNEAEATVFADKLCQQLKSMCSHGAAKISCIRQKMWEAYYKYCSSGVARTAWETFLAESVSIQVCPIFYQFVTKAMMDETIKEVFKITSTGSITIQQKVKELDFEEMNAVRYTSGYVLKSLLKKVSGSRSLGIGTKEEMTKCLKELTESDSHDEGERSSIDNDSMTGGVHVSETWTKMIDRGGLVHVTDPTFMLFVSMEMVVRRCLESVLRPFEFCSVVFLFCL